MTELAVTRVVLYAEGAGEVAGSITQLPPVGEPLREEQLGSAHVLVRRALMDEWEVGVESVRFDRPQTHVGRQVKGSELLHERALRQLLLWPRATQQPDLAVVLVDADGDKQRRTRLRSVVTTVRQTTIVAVAIQEFEAWLLAYEAAINEVLSTTISPIADPEAFAPREAKRRLMDLLTARGGEGRQLRRDLASKLSLEQLRLRCPAFNDLLQELRAVRPSPA